MPDQSRSAAAERCGDYRSPPEDQAGLGQSAARSCLAVVSEAEKRDDMTARNVAVVTGGSTGIGAEICRQMLAADYEVVSLALDKPQLTHARLYAVEVDLMDRGAADRAAHEIARRFPVSHLIHNAGVIRPDLLPDVKQDDLDALTQLHLGSAIALAQAVLPAMRRERFGRIVMMSSRGAL